MKPLKAFIILTVMPVLLLCCVGCRKTPAPWASLNFAGNFSGTEMCLLDGNLPDTLHIVATGPTEVSITNLYGQAQPINGNISNDSCVIEPQTCNGYVLQGLLLLSNDTISMSVIASSFSREDKCNAVLVK